MMGAGFELHKWHTNCLLAESSTDPRENDSTYAKAFIGEAQTGETKILGVLWNKAYDTLTINFEGCTKVAEPVIKRKRIAAVSRIFDILGWSSPITITDKVIFGQERDSGRHRQQMVKMGQRSRATD